MIKAYHRQTLLSAIRTLKIMGVKQCSTLPLKPLMLPSNSLTEISSNTSTPQPLGVLPPPTLLLGTTSPKIANINAAIAYTIQKALTKTMTFSTPASVKTFIATPITKTCQTSPSTWRPSPPFAPQNLSSHNPF
jgi:hypothetical protein